MLNAASRMFPATHARILALLLAAWPIAASAADGSPGQQILATRCAACHATDPGVNKLGPSLAGVFGNASGSVTGFKYSAALKSAHLTWDEATLDKWLQNPSGLVPGTTMFINVPSGGDRQSVIAYLKTLPGAPR